MQSNLVSVFMCKIISLYCFKKNIPCLQIVYILFCKYSYKMDILTIQNNSPYPRVKGESFIIMVFVSKKEIKELAFVTNAQQVTGMSMKDRDEIKNNDHPTLLVSTFSSTYGHTTSSLYVGQSGKFYFEEGQRMLA